MMACQLLGILPNLHRCVCWAALATVLPGVKGTGVGTPRKTSYPVACSELGAMWLGSCWPRLLGAVHPLPMPWRHRASWDDQPWCLGVRWAGCWPGAVTRLSLPGAGHRLVHRLPVPHPGLVSGVLGREGRERSLRHLRRCALVGPGESQPLGSWSFIEDVLTGHGLPSGPSSTPSRVSSVPLYGHCQAWRVT